MILGKTSVSASVNKEIPIAIGAHLSGVVILAMLKEIERKSGCHELCCIKAFFNANPDSRAYNHRAKT